MADYVTSFCVCVCMWIILYMLSLNPSPPVKNIITFVLYRNF